MEQQAARERFFQTLFFLSALLICPFNKFLLQFFFAWQVKLVFAGVNVGVFGKGDLDQEFFFLQSTMPMVWFSASVLTWRSK
jgi:hypothetical protein